MKAAIYCRYSTDMQREASIEDQARNCEQLADREGWGIGARYEDKALSGTRIDRPGYQRMLTDAKARHFDVLLVDDLSRLARDSVENEQTLRRLEHWGIRVIGVCDGYDSSSKSRKVQRGVRGLVNELYIDDLREKTHRGLTGQALKGNNTGGRAYGYQHVPMESPTEKDTLGRPVVTAVRRVRDREQMKIVHEIFTRYAGGQSPRTIADDLNHRAIPSPGSTWKRVTRRHDAKWLGSTIVAMLGNPLYIGKVIWNRSQWIKDPDTGKTQRRERPESEWIVTEDPTLAIVDKPTWDAVQARRHERAALYNNQCPDIRPRQKYLFSGLLKCEVCGSSFVITDAYRYGCSSHVNGGQHACSNAVKVPRRLVEEKLLAGIKRDLCSDEALAQLKRLVLEAQAERRKAKQPDLNATRHQLAFVEQGIENLVSAIKAGTFSPTLKAELEKAEKERERLQALLKVDTRSADKVVQLVLYQIDHYRTLVGDLSKVMQRDVARARARLKTLLGGQILLRPTEQGYLEAKLTGSYAGLFKLVSNGSTDLNLRGSGGRI